MPERGITVLIFKERIMKLNKKKGFTIVELVIVIAIIAILAAVLIPTFASLIRKANESADIQACRQMNTYLAVNEVTEGKSILEVYRSLKDGGMSAKDYRPLVTDRYFFWDSTLNRIVYTDSTYKVLFPEDYTTATNKNGWFSLSGEIKKEDFTVNEGKVTIEADKAAGQLYALACDKEKLATVNEIVLPANREIDLMGAEVCLEIAGTNDSNNPKAFIFNGNGATLKGISSIKSKGVNEGKEYFAGLFSTVGVEGNDKKGIQASYCKFVVKNLTIKDSTFGDFTMGSVGAIAGKVCSQSTLICKNVKIENCEINAKNKVGAFVGQSRDGCKIYIDKDCAVTGTTIKASDGEAGKLIGTYHNGNSGTGEIVFAIPTNQVDVTVVLTNKDGWTFGTVTEPTEAKGITAVKIKDDKIARLFSENAYINVRDSVKVNDQAYSGHNKDTSVTVNGTSTTCGVYFAPVTDYTPVTTEPTWVN